MSILETLMGQAGNIDLAAIGKQVGLSPEQVKLGGEAMLGKLTGGTDADGAAAHAAAETGLDIGKLTALLPALAQQFGAADTAGLAEKLGLTGDGFMGKIGDMLDRDGDGNPLDDIAGMASGMFGRK